MSNVKQVPHGATIETLWERVVSMESKIEDLVNGLEFAKVSLDWTKEELSEHSEIGIRAGLASAEVSRITAKYNSPELPF